MTPEEFVRLNNLQKQMKRASRQNRESRRKVTKAGLFDHRTASGIIVPDPEPSPEHYHIIYHVPKEGLSIPHWQTPYIEAHDAWEEMKRVGQLSEPNTEWYEDGQVGIETTMHDRTGLFWVILQAAACIRSTCAPAVRRENVKRSLVVMPGNRK